jgi:chorismate synthase
MSDGAPVFLRAHFKPTPSIFREQDTVDVHGDPRRLAIRGRHDPVIVPRAAVVVEAMCALTVLDALLLNMTARADSVIDHYRK